MAVQGTLTSVGLTYGRRASYQTHVSMTGALEMDLVKDLESLSF